MNYYTNVKTEFEYLLQFYKIESLERFAKGDENKIIELYNQAQPKTVTIGSLLGDTEKQEYSYVVDSPDGWVPVVDCVEKLKDKMYHVVMSNGTEIHCSHDHLFQKVDLSWHYARDLQPRDILITNYGEGSIQSINLYEEETKVYDLSVDHDNHRYYTNDVCSHNTGKSLFLQNHGVNHWKRGMNVVKITLELHPELVSRRMDSMLLNKGTGELYDNIDNTAIEIMNYQRNGAGSMKVKYMPSGTKTSELKNYLKQYMTETGERVDVLIVDYLDLLAPAGKYSVGDTFTKDKFVSEELRNIAQEFEFLCITASQLNRTAVGLDELDHSHIAGGLSKINTADLVLGIITNNTMREKGQYELQILKSRNSQGTGRKFPLLYNTRSMKIYDDPDYLMNINTYNTQSVAQSNQMRGNSEIQKQMNEIQNLLNSDNTNYTPVEVEEESEVQPTSSSPQPKTLNSRDAKLANLRNLINKGNRT